VDRVSAVSLDRYWNLIGVPLFFVVLTFGIFVLYKIGPLQSAGQTILPALIASWKRVPRTLPAAAPTKPAAAPVAAAAAAAPKAPAAKAAGMGPSALAALAAARLRAGKGKGGPSGAAAAAP
jgi:hypothetical protein